MEIRRFSTTMSKNILSNVEYNLNLSRLSSKGENNACISIQWS